MARSRIAYKYGRFGDSARSVPGAQARVLDAGSQKAALAQLGQLARRATVDPYLRNTALKIIRECAQRDDACELDAIYYAVKHGDPAIPALVNGIKYVADPRYADYFTSPVDTLKNAERGANGGDCLPGETLLFAPNAELGATSPFKPIAIKDISVNTLVYDGVGGWPKITQWWDKGVQRIIGFVLRGGGMLKCTPNHRVFVVDSPFDTTPQPREVEAGTLRLGDHLLTGRLPADYAAIVARQFGREPAPRGECGVRIDGILELAAQQTYDIEVVGHRFYLPETDLIVHNCDDHSALIASLAGACGWKAGLRAWGPKGLGGFSHVYPVVAFPKRARQTMLNGQLMGVYDNVFGMDTTVDEATVGWEPPHGEVLTCWLD